MGLVSVSGDTDRLVVAVTDLVGEVAKPAAPMTGPELAPRGEGEGEGEG